MYKLPKKHGSTPGSQKHLEIKKKSSRYIRVGRDILVIICKHAIYPRI